ncbi:pyocin knob domain-containing protein, partial [Buttiauxella gaviniae]|uniref:pyocin knob domain-containing protein n=1 Tax=Buttiauxella gaviniae TaxID=82990 RepID=UPI001FD74D19
MSENNYGALMMKSAVAAGDDINAIVQPGIYIIPPANSSSPDAAGGVLTVHSGSPIRRTFTSDSIITLTSTRNGNSWTAWKGPLSRTNPGADIKADGAAAIASFLSNLGITQALELKAPLDSPSLSGTPTVPNANQDEIDLRIANTSFVAQAIAELNGGAPTVLNTLKKLATAINNDADFFTTISNALGAKAPLASPSFTGTPSVPNADQNQIDLR